MEAVRRRMPQYDYLFYGDTKRLPYGDKSEKEIYELTKKGVKHLFTNGARIVIVACNTASAETLRRLQDAYLMDEHPDKKILGVIVPTIEEVAERRLRHVLLIGTKRTIGSQKYERELQKCMIKSIQFRAIATPQLVPLIEKKDITNAADSITDIFEQHITNGGDSVLLGCTHYSTLKKLLRERYGHLLEIISQDEIIPYKLKRYLEAHPEYETRLSRLGTQSVFLTGEV